MYIRILRAGNRIHRMVAFAWNLARLKPSPIRAGTIIGKQIKESPGRIRPGLISLLDIQTTNFKTYHDLKSL